MEKSKNVLLPGLKRQLGFLLEEQEVSGFTALVIGAESGQIAIELAGRTNSDVEIIVEDYHSLINTKLTIEESKNVGVKLMDFSATDYKNETFDLVYAQASTGTFNRNAFAKEIKRITRSGRFFCVGELTLKKEKAPPFVMNMFDSSGLAPLLSSKFADYWSSRGWEVLAQVDLSKTLKEFYTYSAQKLNAELLGLSDSEKSYYKSLIKQISHNSNVYNKLGGDKFIGYNAVLLRKM